MSHLQQAFCQQKRCERLHAQEEEVHVSQILQVRGVPQVFRQQVEPRHAHQNAHRGKALRVRHLRQEVRHQKRPAKPRGHPQRREEVQVRGVPGPQGLQDEERPGQAHGVPLRPEALVREVQQEVLHFERFEVARKKKQVLA